MPEVAMILDEDFETIRPPATATGGPIPYHERLRLLAEYRQLTPRQKLERFQEERRR